MVHIQALYLPGHGIRVGAFVAPDFENQCPHTMLCNSHTQDSGSMLLQQSDFATESYHFNN